MSTRAIQASTAIDSDLLVRQIFSSTMDHALFTVDLDGTVTSWNAGAARITGYSENEMIGQDHAVVFTTEDRMRGEPRQEMEIAGATGRAEDYRWHARKDGSLFWADGVMTPIRNQQEQVVGYLKIFRDITDRKLAEEKIHRLANQDMLTELANRHAFERYCGDMIAIAVRTGQPLALHLIDLDRFKQVNDSLGHHAGDALLKAAACRMKRMLRDSDFIARLGGDEFVILQTGMASTRSGADLAEKLIKALSEPFDLHGREAEIGASIGIAICPHDASDMDQMLKKADLALYRAKEEGKGRFHYFTEKLDAIVHRKQHELAQLRSAVERREFRLEYQPKVDTATGRTIQVEALLRCASPAFAGRRTEEIIGLAMEYGLMKELSYWILGEACSQLRAWKQQGLGELKVGVNLCAQDLSDEQMPTIIDAIVAAAELHPADLEIELTERQALEVEHQGFGILHALRTRGFNIALDDFGTGYSALSYLKDFPVNAVKLDKSFLTNVPQDRQSCTIIKSVMELSHALGLEVIAEGVETEAQIDFLRQHPCSAMQGYLISRPLPPDAMTAWLLAQGATLH